MNTTLQTITSPHTGSSKITPPTSNRKWFCKYFKQLALFAVLCLLTPSFGGSFVFAQTPPSYSYDSGTNTTTVTNLPLYTAGTNATLKGDGSSENPYQIGTTLQWDAFATIVNMNEGKPNAWAKLTADITFSGNHQQPGENWDFSFAHHPQVAAYTGTFDGQGHTITLNQQAQGGSSGSNSYGGLFWHVSGATIMNLRVAGKIETKNRMSGAFIQNVSSRTNVPVTIENCISSVNNNWANTNNVNYENAGSFVGDVHPNKTLNIKNCLMDGQFTTNNNYTVCRSGGFVGIPTSQDGDPSTVNIMNCYFHPDKIDDEYQYFSYFCNKVTSNNSQPETRDVYLTINHSYYSLPSTYTGTDQVQQGTVAPAEITELLGGLNTDAEKVNNLDPWMLHNDTIYLRTFAKYVDIVGWTYGSTPNSPTIVGNNGNGTVTYKYKEQGADDATYTTTKPTDVGDYTVLAIVPANNGWNGWTSTMNFSISKADGAISAAPTAASPTYSGIAQGLLATNGTATGTFNYRVGTSGAWSTTPPTETAAGTYSVYYYVTPDGNHNTIDAFGNAESPLGPIEVTIGKAALTVTAKNHSITYGDAPENIGVNYSGFVNSETSAVLGGTLAYAYSYAQYDNAGSYTITPSGLTPSNYAITYMPGTLTVGQKEVGLTWSTDSPFTYDGQSHCLTATATGMVNSDEIGVTVTGEQTNAGDSYTATASALTGTKSSNYKLPAANTQAFTINRRAVTVTPIDDQSKTYGDTDPALTYTATGLVGTETLTGDLTRDAGENVSTSPYAINQGTVTNANNGNYNITFTTGKTFAITPKTIGISWGPTLLTYNNTAQAPTATATGLVGSDVCNLTVTGQQTAVGVYTITDAPATVTALDNTNYQLPTTGLTTGFEIANPLSISFAANQTWATWYGGYNYQVPTGMTAYKVSSVSGSTVTVDAITYVPANTGVLIKRNATDAAVANSNVYNGETSVITSLLRNGSPTAYTDYILYNDAFVLSSVSTIGEHRCYLPASGAAATRGLTIEIGDGTTDIAPKVVEEIDTGEWYDLQGRRIEKPQKKGLYIRDGKKIVVK